MSVQQTGPYLIGGYCFGGLLALEIAKQLKAKGEEVAMLALIETGGSVGFYRIYRRIVSYMEFHSGKCEQMKFPEKLTYFFELGKRNIYEIISKFPRNKNNQKPVQSHIKSSHNQENCKTILRSTVKNYILPTYSGKVVLFACQKSKFYSFLFPKMGWGNLLNGDIEIQFVPGNHRSLLKEPNVKMLAEKLIADIDQVQETYE